MNLFPREPKAEERFRPLADKMRPTRLENFLGQEEIIGLGKPLRRAIESDNLISIILWGPPGSGKTTLARIVSQVTRSHFVSFSAVTSGIPTLRKVITAAEQRRKITLQRTILFVDEIHRFNKTQQDAFLPYVENGTIVLIGATTENPSFEINSPLLSRSKVYVLKPLSITNLMKVIQRALGDAENGLGMYRVKLAPGILSFIAQQAYGDARTALNIIELAVITTESKKGIREVTWQIVKDVVQKQLLRYDKSGEEHYNIISAVHKSMRDSDPDAALYWVTRMLEGGENPLYIARRLVRFASEDVGNADPQALQVAVSAMQAVQFVGMPEANLFVVQAATYLACAPKSNALLKGYLKAKEDIERTGPLPVPLVIRNAPTQLMKELGYGRGYKYAHDFKRAHIKQPHLPPELAGSKYYQPTERGYEKVIKEKMDQLSKNF